MTEEELRALDRQCARLLGHDLVFAPKAWTDEDWMCSDTPTEINVLAINVGGMPAPLGGGAFHMSIPHYSTDHDAARLLEDAVEKRGTVAITQYMDALWRIVCFGQHRQVAGERYEWVFVRASPSQRARAFVEVMK